MAHVDLLVLFFRGQGVYKSRGYSTYARDKAQHSVVLGCDLFGVAAETSVLVPLERAAQMGRNVEAYYQRPSKFLIQEGRSIDEMVENRNGLTVSQINKLHGKFLTWDDQAVVVTSFNWLATIVQGARSRGAEIGVLATGPELPKILAEKLAASSLGSLDFRGHGG